MALRRSLTDLTKTDCPDMNLADELFQTIPDRHNRPAILGPGDLVLTYGEFAREIDNTARRLKKVGVKPGQVIGLHLPSDRDYIVSTYALWRLGAAVAPVPMELADREKERLPHDIALQGLIARRRDDHSLFSSMSAGWRRKLGETTFFRRLHPVRETPAGLGALDPAFVRFTSGTTGTAKGVVLSHQSVWERIHAANETMRLGPEDRVVWLLSMAYHFTVSIVNYLQVGAGIVLCPNHLGKDILASGRRHGGTFIYGAPMHFEMLNLTREGSWPTLRTAVSTTAALRKGTAEAFEQRFGVPLGQALGIIEVGLPFISMTPSPAQRGSVGAVAAPHEVRLEDVDMGDAGRAVLLKGPGFFDAYYSPWRLRDEVLTDGWFDTGDLGRIDENGWLWLTGRSKDMISVGGLKVFPQEVELVLNEHPAVDESCVYRHRSTEGSEMVHARLVLVRGQDRATTIEQLQDYLADRLAVYKIPSRIEAVDHLPRTASGKLIRDEKRMQIAAELAV